MKLGQLPEGKSAEDVMSDFMQYLYKATELFIRESVNEGERLWNEVKDGGRIDFVFGHPNGWTGLPQQRMRRCAVAAGLVTDVHALGQVKFISEGEASALSCLADACDISEIKVSTRLTEAEA